MSSADVFPAPTQFSPKRGDPVWDLALMYPLQGGWTVEDYLQLDSGLLIEFTDGFIRVLPMPTLLHQWIVRFLFQLLSEYVQPRQLGEVYFAPLPVRLGDRKYREPDLVFLTPRRIESMEAYPAGADLVVEVVSDSPEDRRRDYEEKRFEYETAGVAEYWIVDPPERKLTVLALQDGRFREHGVFTMGETGTSRLFPDLEIPVSELFSRCEA